MSPIALAPNVERKLVQAARKDKSKFGPLYQHYNPYVQEFFKYRVSDPVMADELTSVVFEKALNGLDNFQWQGIPFSAWLFRIARNTLIDHYRRSNRNKSFSSLEYLQDLPSADKEPSEQVESMFAEELLYRVLQELPAREKEIIMLKFFDGYTNRVIAQITSLSETNIGTIIFRTIRKLRDLYRDGRD